MFQSHHVHRNQYITWELNWGLALYSKFDKDTTIIAQKLQINTDIHTLCLFKGDKWTDAQTDRQYLLNTQG
jgi:hypothetical protein